MGVLAFVFLPLAKARRPLSKTCAAMALGMLLGCGGSGRIGSTGAMITPPVSQVTVHPGGYLMTVTAAPVNGGQPVAANFQFFVN